MPDPAGGEQIGLLAGMTVVELSALAGGMVGSVLAELGATVIKVDPQRGDPVRRAGSPAAAGTTLLDAHLNGAKRRAGPEVIGSPDALLHLVAAADVLVEGVRPGTLDDLGLTLDTLWEANPNLVVLRITGFGVDGPYSSLPTHGTAWDAWAGLLSADRGSMDGSNPADRPPVAMGAGPLLGAVGVLAAVLRSRGGAGGCELEIANAEVGAWLGWHGLAAHRQAALRAPGEAEAGPDAEGEGTARHRVYATGDGLPVLLMAPEETLWQRFADAVDLSPAERSLRGPDLALILEATFARVRRREWLDRAVADRLPISPVNTAADLADDAHFRDRMRWRRHGDTDLLRLPMRVRPRG